MEPIDRRAHPKDAVFRTWTAPDGWPVRRMDWPQPQGARVRGSLLFANGRGDFIEKYLEALAHWHRRGWNVVSFDWRGQGSSRGSIARGHLDDFDPLVAEGAALAKGWMAETPGPHVAIGHSMGGHLLLRILAEHRLDLTAAVLVAPMLGINARPLHPRIGGWTARLLTALGLRRRPAWRHNERPSPRTVLRQSYLTNSRERYADELWWKEREPGYDLGPPTWGWLNAAYRSVRSLTSAAMARVEVPILLLGTERDRLVDPAAIRRAVHHLPRSELLMFADAAHELLREEDRVRDQALARIDAFFDQHAPG